MARPTAADKRHFTNVVALGCIACKNLGHDDTPCEVHHIYSGALGKKASNDEVIPLCPIHHRTGGYRIAVHSGRDTWEGIHGTEKELLEQVRGLL